MLGLPRRRHPRWGWFVSGDELRGALRRAVQRFERLADASAGDPSTRRAAATAGLALLELLAQLEEPTSDPIIPPGQAVSVSFRRRGGAE